MRVLVCPDKFRGTLTARQAAEAIERGWLRERPDDVIDLVPLADGGEGTLDVLAPTDAADARRLRHTVAGPLGDRVEAEFGVRRDVGIVEMARASGLELVSARRRDPMHATTRGTGELIATAIESGARRLLVCLGGSATNDAGVGMASALGGRFLDGAGDQLDDGAAALVNLDRIDVRAPLELVRDLDVIGVTDVDNPLCGPAGASTVFGPQKGASPQDVVLLDRALAHVAAIAARDLGVDLSHEPGAGAAGGLGFGLLAFCGARLRRGVEVVMEAVAFDRHLAEADTVITGEGSFDAQSLRGKVPAGVLDASRLAAKPVLILCGVASAEAPGATVRSLVDLVGAEEAVRDARRSLESLAAAVASDQR